MPDGLSLIDIRSLRVCYGKKSPVLEEVSLRVEKGEVYALLGRNGAGKSSLIRCLLGHQKPQAGRISIFGQDVWRKRQALMKTIGVVPESPDAPPDMHVLALSRFFSHLYPHWDQAGLLERLDRFEVPLRAAFGKLSRGQKSQVMMALALASEPELLILDDPTLGLDVVARKAVFEELISELAERGTTVFLTSHDLPGIESIASRISLLHGGRLLLDEDLERLKARFRRIRFGPAEDAADLGERMEPLTTARRGRDVEALLSRFDEAELAALRSQTGWARLEVTPVSLEEILVAVSERERSRR